MATAVEKLGGLTTLVNNAGVLQGGVIGTDAASLANFDHNFNANTRAPFELMTLAVTSKIIS